MTKNAERVARYRAMKTTYNTLRGEGYSIHPLHMAGVYYGGELVAVYLNEKCYYLEEAESNRPW